MLHKSQQIYAFLKDFFPYDSTLAKFHFSNSKYYCNTSLLWESAFLFILFLLEFLWVIVSKIKKGDKMNYNITAHKKSRRRELYQYFDDLIEYQASDT